MIVICKIPDRPPSNNNGIVLEWVRQADGPVIRVGVLFANEGI